jgi:peptidoglycan/LPS O-acetylase OafA/YrhL
MSLQYTKAHTFATLDMLRGLAAFAVLIGHSNHLNQSVYPFFSGLYAVDLFFVMSGFVIPYAYENKLNLGLNVSQFFAVRMIRLWPLYALGSAIGILYISIFEAYALHKFAIMSLFAIFMLPTPGCVQENLFPANNVAWSLFFELLINVIYAATWRRWTIMTLMAVCLISLVSLVFCRIWFLSFDIGWAWNNAIGGLARVCFGFPMGVLLYRLWRSGKLNLRVPMLVVIATTIIILVPISEWGLGASSGFFGYVLEIVWIALLIPLIVSMAVVVEPSMMFRKSFLLLGRISYAIYVIHYPIIQLSAKLFPHSLFVGVSTIFVVLIGAWVLDIIYDAPVRTILSLQMRRIMLLKFRSVS